MISTRSLVLSRGRCNGDDRALPGGVARADVAGYDLTEAMVPMRDGVKLHTVIYRPKKQDGPLPIVLMRTPYGVDLGGPLRWANT